MRPEGIARWEWLNYGEIGADLAIRWRVRGNARSGGRAITVWTPAILTAMGMPQRAVVMMAGSDYKETSSTKMTSAIQMLSEVPVPAGEESLERSPFVHEFFMVQVDGFQGMAYCDEAGKWRAAYNDVELLGDVGLFE